MIAILLLAGSAVLGVLQVRLVSTAARAEEQRQRLSLSRSAERTVADAEQDIRAILSLTRIDPADYAARNWGAILRGLSIWYANARFPDLLHGLYIVQELPSAGVLVYSRERGRMEPETLPSDLREVLPVVLSRARAPWSWPSIATSDLKRVVVEPLFLPGAADPPGPFTAAVIIELDAGVFFSRIVPHYVSLDLGDLPFRVVEMGTNRILAQSESMPAGRRPEVIAAVSSLPTGMIGPQGVAGPGPAAHQDPGSPGPAFDRAHLDPLLQSWMQRAGGEGAPLNGPAPGGPPIDHEARLEVFSVKGSLTGTIRQQEALGIVFSLGILGVLVASVFVLARLYTRSAALRMSEQRFVASMSHELRTPISVIQATSENLRRGVVSDPARVARYSEVIYGQIRRLAGMVESILLYSGLQSGRPRAPSLSAIDMQGLIDEVIQPLFYLAADRGSTLTVSIDVLPDRIRCDRMALSVIIENLLTNAIRHADPAGIRLRVEGRGGRLRIIVEDDGPGIPAREQRRIFEPFVRGERSIREQKPGSGLGLNLAQSVVGLLGGTIVLESPYVDDPGGLQPGCRFIVELPLQEVRDDA
jgi:signal transduction histidine kinase